MTNVEALKNLYVALGGMIDDVEDFNLSVEVINAIAGIAGSGGSSLPAVTAEDNDKVLTVVNGEWDKAAPSGGEIPMIHIAWDETNNNYVTIETGNEIYEMFSPEGVYGGVVAEVTSYKTIVTVSKSEIDVEIGYMEGPEILHIITAEKDSNDPVIVD